MPAMSPPDREEDEERTPPVALAVEEEEKVTELGEEVALPIALVVDEEKLAREGVGARDVEEEKPRAGALVGVTAVDTVVLRGLEELDERVTAPTLDVAGVEVDVGAMLLLLLALAGGAPTPTYKP